MPAQSKCLQDKAICRKVPLLAAAPLARWILSKKKADLDGFRCRTRSSGLSRAELLADSPGEDAGTLCLHGAHDLRRPSGSVRFSSALSENSSGPSALLRAATGERRRSRAAPRCRGPPRAPWRHFSQHDFPAVRAWTSRALPPPFCASLFMKNIRVPHSWHHN